MARRKGTPERSSLTRPQPLAYARRERGAGDSGTDTPGDGGDDDDDKAGAAAAAKPDVKADAAPAEAPKAEAPKADAPADAKPAPAAVVATAKPDAPTERTRADTMLSTQVVGEPPAVPNSAPVVTPAAGASGVEDPTFMPTHKQIPDGDPDDPALAPGHVPAGDSRSYRRGHEFALVYRQGTFLISRAGAVGTRGVWRVVEYPTSGAASNSYARECSRLR